MVKSGQRVLHSVETPFYQGMCQMLVHLLCGANYKASHLWMCSEVLLNEYDLHKHWYIALL